MTRTRAIVFDVGGVRIDSEELHAHAKHIAFAHAGIALTHADLRAYVGRSDGVMIDQIGARYELTGRQRSTVLNEKTRMYEQEEQGIKIAPGAIEFVRWAAQHYRLAIATSATPKESNRACMSISANYGPAADRNEGIKIIRAAHEKASRIFDTAEVYGP